MITNRIFKEAKKKFIPVIINKTEQNRFFIVRY